ncbi:hypothetical protein FKW77_001600 [Venturia effusa]|uniref:Uncharacterized protein n=1 Tax=Venturia effusa TaxID=50376 RepID=A0A517LIC0_9PEZI|nr:hypothetical protein FKW77_001600 [Venturia effusa]
MRSSPASLASSNSSIELRTPTRSSSIRVTDLYKATMNRMFTRKKAKAAKAEPKPELDLSIALPASENFRTSLLMPNLSARFSMLREQDDPTTKIGKAVDDSVLSTNRQSRMYDFQSPYGLDDIAEVASMRSSIRPPFAQQKGRATSYASDGGYNTDDDSSHSGSVMSRARPGEGNVLFGGRQKIYKIAGDGLKGRTLYEDDVGSTSFRKNSQEEREREEAERLQELKDIRNAGKAEPYANPVKGPSSINSSTRHTSSSTTASAMDSRASTTATSINSQGASTVTNAATSAASTVNFSQPIAAAPAPALERSATKRRLYEQGLDRDIQDQQSQQITRLNSIAKGRGALAGNGRTTPDIFNSRPSQDRLHRPGVTATRSQSPTRFPAATPPQPNTSNVASVRNGTNGNSKNVLHGQKGQDSHPPSEHISPVSPHGDSTALASALNPSDRGKATAMGVFNKPQQFSEQQFLERTRTLRKEREAPLRTHSEGLGDSPKESEEVERDQAQEMRAFHPGPTTPANISGLKSRGPTSRSRSGSSVRKYEPAAAVRTPLASPIEEHAGVSAFQRAAMQVKAIEVEASPVKETMPAHVKETLQAAPNNRYAFTDDSESDYEQDQPVPSSKPSHTVRLPQIPALPNMPAVASSTAQHPALRDYPDLPEHPAFRSPKLPDIDLSNEADVDTISPGFDFGQPKSNNQLERESPTRGPSSGGLSGMVRQHLRQGSDASRYSVTQPPAPEPFPSSLQTRNLSNASKNYPNNAAANLNYSHSNPWDLDEYDDFGIDINSPVSPLESSANTPRQNGRPSQENNDFRRHVPPRTAEPPREAPWQEELRKKSHNRGLSSETQAEQEAFTSEIAARQRAIKEQLKAKAESDSRSSSPGPGRTGPFSGLGTLRMKTSRESSQVRDPNARVAKFPGLNGSSSNLHGHTPSPPATTTTSDRPSYDRWKSDRSDRSEPPPQPDLRQRSRSRADTNRSREPMQPFPSYSNGMGSVVSLQSASRPAIGRESDERMRSRSDSNVNSTRTRSNSEHSVNGRSRSRSGRYRDDLAEAMAVGNSSRTTMFPEATPAIPEQYAADFPAQVPVPDHPIPAIPHSLKESNALRSQQATVREGEFRPLERQMSRDADNREKQQFEPPAFEQKGLWPPPTNGLGIPSPRPSPGYPPAGSAYSPALSHGMSPRPSPGLGGVSPALSNSRGSPFAGNPTPPVSASSTPIAPSFPGGNNTHVLSSSTYGRKPTHRKTSIKKTEISEPRLISTTSVIDTVDLPAGASLMNGMQDVPPFSASNARRKRFGFGRGELDAPEPPFVHSQYNSLSADERERQPRSKHRLRKSSSDGAKIGLHIRAQQQAAAGLHSTPTLPHKMSPPRLGKAVEGGMF